jgi:predicted metal-dependent hydrolase
VRDSADFVGAETLAPPCGDSRGLTLSRQPVSLDDERPLLPASPARRRFRLRTVVLPDGVVSFGPFVTTSSTRSAPVDEDPYPPKYLEGIEFFNNCDFFESHEAWEELWQEDFGPSRKFLQGLIQAAVALHHFGNGNIRGAKKVFYGSCGYLEPYRPKHMGIDLDKFLGELKVCFADVVASQEEFPQIEIVADRIPEIHLEA